MLRLFHDRYLTKQARRVWRYNRKEKQIRCSELIEIYDLAPNNAN